MLSTNAAGLTLRNPLLPGSGPLTGDAERMISLARQGIGGIVTKTIAPKGAEVKRPCIAGTSNMIFNSEAWSEYPGEIWYNEFIPELRRHADIPVIASVGYDESDLRGLVPKLESMVEGYEYIPRYVGKDFDEVARIVGALRKLTTKPVWVKMNASISDPVGFAAACRNSGADGVVAVTSLGPNMVIDIKRRRPLIGTDSGYVWTSGPAIKPLALAYVNMIKEAFPSLSVIGCGGCSSADDVLEFLLAGADAVQILSIALLKGRDMYAKILADLPRALQKYGFGSIEEVKATGLTKSGGSDQPSYPEIDGGTCTGCALCANNCPYFAMEMKGKLPIVDKGKCFGCGLCESRCPVKAISNVII
ncbi:MAG: 4Fe-4S dicluster domain-containing protein [Bacillota bacterium]